jgi:pyruvate dehydrogenase E1 component beta subunit
MKYFQAVSAALRSELERDPTVFVMGEDVGHPDGIFAQTRSLQSEFGVERVRDTPAGEVGFLGAAVGAAATGLRPVVEISFADFFPVCMDQVVNQIAKIRYMSGGQTKMPITITSFGGARLNAGPQHSGTFEAWLGSLPGLKVATPATPPDVCGMLRWAIRDDDPCIVLLHKAFLQHRGDVPDHGDFMVPFGQADTLQSGNDLSMACWAGGVPAASEAAELLSADGIDVDLIDLRSVQPLDIDTLIESIKRTNRMLLVQETSGFSGIGAEIAARVQSEAFDYLDAPIERVAAPFTPVPFSPPLENFVLPDADRVVKAAKELVA